MTSDPVAITSHGTRPEDRDQAMGAQYAGYAGSVGAVSTFMVIGLGGLFTLVPAMMADVVDVLIPAATSAVAIWAVATYPITEEVARKVRRELEARRGTPETLAVQEDAGAAW